MRVDSPPILVTGAHRTGTTWVGRILATAPDVAYISEPLNVFHGPGVLGYRVDNWYAYICPENEPRYLPAFRQLLSYRYHLGAALMSIRSVRDLGRMARDFAIFAAARLRRQTALLKDPFAVFSLRWFAERLMCRTVVTVRHPAAFASGLKRLNWAFDFQNLMRQPLLMRDHLESYHPAMLSGSARDVIGQAGLLWTMIYATVHKLRSSVPGVHVVRQEDLALKPVEGFRQLYGQLGLEYSPRIESAIVESSRAGNPAELSRRRTHSVRMDSRASLNNWKQRLSPAEVARVRDLTDGVAQLYYPEESWN